MGRALEAGLAAAAGSQAGKVAAQQEAYQRQQQQMSQALQMLPWLASQEQAQLNAPVEMAQTAASIHGQTPESQAATLQALMVAMQNRAQAQPQFGAGAVARIAPGNRYLQGMIAPQQAMPSQGNTLGPTNRPLGGAPQGQAPPQVQLANPTDERSYATAEQFWTQELRQAKTRSAQEKILTALNAVSLARRTGTPFGKFVEANPDMGQSGLGGAPVDEVDPAAFQKAKDNLNKKVTDWRKALQGSGLSPEAARTYADYLNNAPSAIDANRDTLIAIENYIRAGEPTFGVLQSGQVQAEENKVAAAAETALDRFNTDLSTGKAQPGQSKADLLLSVVQSMDDLKKYRQDKRQVSRFQRFAGLSGVAKDVQDAIDAGDDDLAEKLADKAFSKYVPQGLSKPQEARWRVLLQASQQVPVADRAGWWSLQQTTPGNEFLSDFIDSERFGGAGAEKRLNELTSPTALANLAKLSPNAQQPALAEIDSLARMTGRKVELPESIIAQMTPYQIRELALRRDIFNFNQTKESTRIGQWNLEYQLKHSASLGTEGGPNVNDRQVLGSYRSKLAQALQSLNVAVNQNRRDLSGWTPDQAVDVASPTAPVQSYVKKLWRASEAARADLNAKLKEFEGRIQQPQGTPQGAPQRSFKPGAAVIGG